MNQKKENFRGNHKAHVNKTLHSGIMKCSQLKIKAMKSKPKSFKFLTLNFIILEISNVFLTGILLNTSEQILLTMLRTHLD